MREYRLSPEEWKMRHEYGRRSLVERVMSMLKMRHRGCLSSRADVTRHRELPILVVLHNVERMDFLECASL